MQGKHLAIRALSILLTANISMVQAQYYFNDLYTKERNEKTQGLYKAFHVRKITETAILPTGERQPNVLQWTDISQKADTSTLHRSVEGSVSKTVLLYDDQSGNLLSQLETEADRRHETKYNYNSSGQIERIETVYIDSQMDFKDHEIHVWTFEKNNRPKSMWRIVVQFDGSMDSTYVDFATDKDGRITEENIYRKGKKTGFYYYYYNDEGRLTDVVKYNEKWKRLLPEIMLEYDPAGNTIQKRQLIGNRDISYLIWRYNYDKNGLMDEEALFNSKKQQTGSLIYSYEYY
jgi:hypothetical protein